jgi:hypothetical protein
MKKLSIPLTWGLIFFFGVLGLFERQVIELNATSLVHAAPSDVYCVIPATATLGVFAGCTQVFTTRFTVYQTPLEMQFQSIPSSLVKLRRVSPQ